MILLFEEFNDKLLPNQFYSGEKFEEVYKTNHIFINRDHSSGIDNTFAIYINRAKIKQVVGDIQQAIKIARELIDEKNKE
jgi:hypothetical protein